MSRLKFDLGTRSSVDAPQSVQVFMDQPAQLLESPIEQVARLPQIDAEFGVSVMSVSSVEEWSYGQEQLSVSDGRYPQLGEALADEVRTQTESVWDMPVKIPTKKQGSLTKSKGSYPPLVNSTTTSTGFTTTSTGSTTTSTGFTTTSTGSTTSKQQGGSIAKESVVFVGVKPSGQKLAPAKLGAKCKRPSFAKDDFPAL